MVDRILYSLFINKFNHIPLKYIDKSCSNSSYAVWDYDDLKKRMNGSINCCEQYKSCDGLDLLPLEN